MTVDSFCHHLVHPFKAPNTQLKSWEKCVVGASLALAVFGVIPGLVAFYGLAYYFKVQW